MILFALALLASPSEAAPAPTSVPAVAAPATQAKGPDDLDKVICHVDAETGTRLGTHKECHTKREWVQMQEEESRSLDRATTTH